MLDTITHADDCVAEGDQECSPVSGQWCQPSGWAVSEATAQLDDEAPWCRVRHLAWDLNDA